MKNAGVSAKISHSSRARVISAIRAIFSGGQWLSVARAVGVQVTLGKFDSFADHDSHGDTGDTFLVGQTESVPDVIAVVNERLWREVGKAGAKVVFAFCPGVDYNVGTSESPCDLDFFTDGVDKSLRGEGTDDAGSTDDGDSPDDT